MIYQWTNKVLLASALAVCALCPMILAAATEPEHVVVIQVDTSYSPDTINIKLGQVLEVRNEDEFWHQSRISKVDENGFERDVVFEKKRDRRGAKWEYTLKESGNYMVRCLNHDGMTADIVVTQ